MLGVGGAAALAGAPGSGPTGSSGAGSGGAPVDLSPAEEAGMGGEGPVEPEAGAAGEAGFLSR